MKKEMTKEQFINEVKESILDYLSEKFEGAEVNVQEVIKNNDTKLTGLIVRTEECDVSPTLYLDGYYEVYTEHDDLTFDDVMERIAHTYEDAYEDGLKAEAAELVRNITNYDFVKDKILPRVVNKQFNEVRLTTLAHTELDTDLAVLYAIELGDNGDGMMSVSITNEMLERYGVDTESLHKQAVENLIRDGYDFKTIAEVLSGLLAGSGMDDSDFPDEDCGMYVLSNKSKVFGAAELLNTELMDRIREEKGDFWILPSSVHEVLIVPKTPETELSVLEAMVKEVNATQVEPHEVLSDHVYEYDTEAKTIVSAKAEEDAASGF